MGDVLNRGTKDRPKWYCRYIDTDGKRKQRVTHQPSRALALRHLAEIEARVARGVIGVPEATDEERTRHTITVDEVVKRFLGKVDGVPGYAPPRIKNLARYRRDIRSTFTSRILPTFGTKPAASVRLLDVEHLRDKQLADGLAAESVIHTLGALSKLYNWARRVGLADCANPVQGVERPRTSHSIDYLARVEVQQLLAHLEANAIADGATLEARTRWPMAATAIYCGLRKGELFGVRWPDVVLDMGRLDVLRSYDLLPKSGKPRHVPINPELARVLRWWRKACPTTPESLAFPVEANLGHKPRRPDRPKKDPRLRMGAPEDNLGLSDALVAAKCHAPADGHPWHMLRHSFASHFIMAGGSLFTLQQLLGHSTPLMTQRYAHLAPSFLAGELARLTFATPSPVGVSDLGEERRRRAAAERPDLDH